MRATLVAVAVPLLLLMALLPVAAATPVISDPCGSIGVDDPEPLVLDSIDICTVDVAAAYTDSLELTLTVTAAADRTDAGEVFRVGFCGVTCDGYVEVRPGNVGNRAILRYTCDWDSFMTDPAFPADACLPMGNDCFGEPGEYVVLPDDAVDSTGDTVTVTLRLHELLPHEHITVAPGDQIGVLAGSYLGDGPARVEGDHKGGCVNGYCPSTRIGDETDFGWYVLPVPPKDWQPTATP